MFSLIVATVDRVDHLRRFLSSVAAQRYEPIEVIIGDQNSDNRLGPLIAEFSASFDIAWLRTTRGLSRSRNVALRHATGGIIAFPDDDCEYPSGLLEAVARLLATDPNLDGVVASPFDQISGAPLLRRAVRRREISPRNVWSLTSSIGLFVRSRVAEAVGGFDETLGLGAGTPWGGAEDTDYPLRALSLGFRLVFHPELTVVHPRANCSDSHRAYAYGAGCGRVLRKHSAGLPQVLRLVLVRPAGAALLSLMRGRWREARFYGACVRGRISGWLPRYANDPNLGLELSSAMRPELFPVRSRAQSG